MDKQLHILILEDNASDAELVQRELRKAGLAFTVRWAQDKEGFVRALDAEAPDLILADYSLPGFDGLAALSLARERFPEVPVVIVSGAIGEEVAIATVKAGATDYVLKQRLKRLGPVAQRAIQEAGRLREKHRVEEALRESEERLRLATAAAGIGIFRRDLRRDEAYWSPEMRAIYGVSAGEPATMARVIDLLHPEDRDRTMQAFHAALDPNGSGQMAVDHRIVRRDGSVRWLNVRSRAFFEGEGPERKAVLLIGTVTDITERKRLEQELERAKAGAEAANQAKSRFLANVSHELRTPMHAILGMVNLALGSEVEPAVREFLETAKDSADLLLALLNDLLDCAKIESGKLELESAPFRLRRVLDQVTRVLSVRASEKGIAFSCRVPPEVPDALVGDQFRLRQVLLNLAGNGIKFTERGEVTVRVEMEGLGIGDSGLEGGEGRGERDEGTHLNQESQRASPQSLIPNPQSPVPPVTLRFCVSDTGIGIPRAELDRIFQPFSQADASTARTFGGTGLGLAISSNLVALMRGRIWVESEPGRGSTFSFTVRLYPAQEVPPEPEAPAVLAPPASSLRILLVEDNPASQRLASCILQGRGHKVEIAGDGRQAVRMTEGNPYDVILMDVQMPGMDGLEATAAIRAREQGQHRVPILAMTAHAAKGDRDRCLAGGMDGYLSKPIDARELVELVERMAARSGSAGTALPAIPPETAEPQPPRTAAAFDCDLALQRCLNSRQMLADVIQSFFDEVDRLLPQMHAALRKGDLRQVGRLGHRLKGTVVYLGAKPAHEAALAVERFKQPGGEQVDAEEAVRRLERACGELKAALAEHARDLGSEPAS